MSDLPFVTMKVLDSSLVPDEFDDELIDWSNRISASNNSIHNYYLKDNSPFSEWLRAGGVTESHITIHYNW